MLEVQDLYVSYGMMEVLHGVDINVQDGELISVIGPNGAGKTTLIKAIMGLVKPKSGKILYNPQAGWPGYRLRPRGAARLRTAHGRGEPDHRRLQLLGQRKIEEEHRYGL